MPNAFGYLDSIFTYYSGTQKYFKDVFKMSLVQFVFSAKCPLHKTKGLARCRQDVNKMSEEMSAPFPNVKQDVDQMLTTNSRCQKISDPETHRHQTVYKMSEVISRCAKNMLGGFQDVTEMPDGEIVPYQDDNKCPWPLQDVKKIRPRSRCQTNVSGYFQDCRNMMFRWHIRNVKNIWAG